MSIRFDVGVADRLILECDRVSNVLCEQAMPRSINREMVMEDFTGVYATLFSGACVVESEDRGKLAGRIADLGIQVRNAKLEAQREMQRQEDLGRWQEREDQRERDTGFFQELGDGFSSVFERVPSWDPVVPTPISVACQARTRQRVGGGGISNRSSADPVRLNDFAASSQVWNRVLDDAAQEFRAAWGAFAGECSWVPVESMTCVSVFEVLFAENIADEIWAHRLAVAFELAGGGTLSSSVLDYVWTKWSIFKGVLSERLNDDDFLMVFNMYYRAFDDKERKRADIIAMLDDVAVFAGEYPELYDNLNGFFASDHGGNLSALHQLDVAAIFARADTADASMVLSNLDNVTISSTSKSGVFYSPMFGNLGGKITFSLNAKDARGDYFTLLHEMAHAADYNYGVKTFGSGWITSSFTNSAGLTLEQVATADFVHDARNRLEKIAATQHPGMSAAERGKLVDETIDNLISRPTLTYDEFEDVGWKKEGANGVSQNSALLYEPLKETYKGLLKGPYPSVPSDVFAGITNFKITGSFGHWDDKEYWFEGKNQVRSVERELFSETLAWRITAAQKGNTAGIDTMGRYMPESEKLVDQIVRENG